jgi:hypothetical protein
MPKLSTLMPEELKRSDFFDLSNRIAKSLSFSHVPSSSNPTILRYPGKTSRFPPETRGFLYYHTQTDYPPLSASIRFRRTSSNDPSTFHEGEDLLAPSGIPWQISLPAIVQCQANSLLDYLLHARLVTTEQLKHWDRFLHFKRTNPDLMLHHLTQPFPVKFHSSSIYLSAVTKNDFGVICLRHFFRDRRPEDRPYRGMHLRVIPVCGLHSCSCV